MNSPRRDLLIMLASIAAVAMLTLGLAAAFVGLPAIVADGLTYHTSGARLLNTGVYSSLDPYIEGPSQPDAHQTPGYAIFLAAVYAFLPHRGNAVEVLRGAVMPVALLHLLAAVLTVVLVAGSAYRIGGRRMGWIAGIMGALYLPFGVEAMSMWPESIRLLMNAATLYCAVGLFQAGDSKARKWAAAYGLLGGLTVMVQASIAPWLVVPLVLWGWSNRGDWRRAVVVIALGVAGIAIAMSPWVVRNAITFGRFIPLTTHSGTVWIDSIGGIKLSQTEQAVYDIAVEHGEDGFRAVAMMRLAEKWRQSPSGFIRWKAQQAWQMVSMPWSSQANPAAPLGADIPIIKPKGYRPLDEAQYRGLGVVTRAIHLTVLVLAMIGLLLLWRRPTAWLLASAPLYALALNTVLLPWSRYFYPAMPALMLLAAWGVASLWDRRSPTSASAAAAPSLLA